jgi:hypothetical protein
VPEPQLFEAPADLTLVGDADLQSLETQAVAEFDRVMGLETRTPDDVIYAQRLTGDLDKIRAELRVRKTRADEQAALARQETERQMASLSERVHGPGDGGEPTAAVTAGGDRVDLAALTQATAQGVALALFGDDQGKLEQAKRRFATLSATRDRAPDPRVPERTDAITASVDIPGVQAGQTLPTLEALGEAFRSKAKAIPVTMAGQGAARHLVASVRNRFEHTVDNRTAHAEVERLLRSMVDGVDSADALVAGGGWCAPSEVKYDFFNIASAAPRMIDLPTVGVSRGGIRFPVSPAIGDTFFQANAGSSPASGFGGFAFSMSNATDPWLWTESDDALTVTGSVNKPTLRVPCPSFSEVRLECYGISLTAGNLTDDAYPESTQNFIQLLRAAYAHAINARLISLMQTASESAVSIGTAAHGVIPQLPNAVALAATDYRTRFAMDENAVLEVVLPYWVLEMARSDLGYKPGNDSPDDMAVADATIVSMFTARNVRPQFVSDYQVRGTGLPGVSTNNLAAWPTSVEFMLYAAGTFVHGNGLQLDLGVIRDSVLNAENDFTALWAEECHLIAKVGHQSRRYTAAIRVDGTVGAGVAAVKV